MPGPNGEQCGTCYYFDQIQDGPEGYCRFENAEVWVEARGDASQRLWPRVDANKDWSGDWLDAVTAAGGFSATGAFVTPTGTNFNITDPINWVKYDPGNLLDGAIMDNVTLLNGVLTWSIPGTPPPGTQWEVFASLYGSVTFPTANTFLEISVGTAGVPYSANTLQRLEVNPQMDDVSLAYSLQGLGPVPQSGSAEMLVRSDIGNALFASAVLQLRVQRRA